MVMNQIIEIDGNRAKGTWYFLGPFIFRKEQGQEARWIAVKYTDDYVKVWRVEVPTPARRYPRQCSLL